MAGGGSGRGRGRGADSVYAYYVLVKPEYQGRGIRRELLTRIRDAFPSIKRLSTEMPPRSARQTCRRSASYDGCQGCGICRNRKA